MIKQLWKWLGTTSNRERLAWLGGGAVVVIGGLWTAFVYVFPAKHGEDGSKSVTIDARCGGVGIGGNVSGTMITVGSAGPADCATKPK